MPEGARILRAGTAVAACAAVLVGCGGGDEAAGGGELGGQARVETLARAPVEHDPPADAGWVAWRVELEPGQRIEHRHAFSTVYAEQGGHRLGGRDLQPGGGAIVQAAERHVHEAGEQASVFWEVLLAGPDAQVPLARGAERLFRTGPLEGIPERAEVAFLDVVLPPGGGETTVHTHPGPETIYVTEGPFEYQNAIEGTTTADAGTLKSIPPDTAVQKRNPGDGEASFLSWFIVDPDQEFAPASRFPGGGP